MELMIGAFEYSSYIQCGFPRLGNVNFDSETPR